MDARGKLFSLAKVNATTARRTIQAIEQLSKTRGTAHHTLEMSIKTTSHYHGPKLGLPEFVEFYQAPDKIMGDAQAETERTVSIQRHGAGVLREVDRGRPQERLPAHFFSCQL